MKNKKPELITWLILLISAIIFYFYATHFAVLLNSYRLPLFVIIAGLLLIAGIISVLARGDFRTFAVILTVMLAMLMIASFFFLSIVRKDIVSQFKDDPSEYAVINVYALKSNDRTDLSDYDDPILICQNQCDRRHQNYGLQEVQKQLNVTAEIINEEDIVSAAQALYKGEGDLLILNEIYIDQLKEITIFSDFTEKTKVVASIIKEEEIPQEEVHKDISNSMFTFLVAGSDSREEELSLYGRTDVNLLVNINPVTRQVMIIGIPRDTYIPNPALDYGLDKLTHLGNDGIQNTMEGIRNYYDMDVDYYAVVNFYTFKSIIDAVGGIDVNNPYYFSSAQGEDGVTYEFPEGTVHLSGNAALAYVRERKSLPNGDYGRSEHETIVMKAILQKLMSLQDLEESLDVLNVIMAESLTDINAMDAIKLAAVFMNDPSQFDIITYHLGGEADMCGTASMGWDTPLYVVHPFNSQVKFIQQETEKMKNHEIIYQESLPNEDDTTYIPN